MLRFCLAFLLLASSAYGQIASSVVKYSQVTGLKNPVVIGSSVFVDAIDGQVTTKPVAFILAKSESGAEIRVEASDQARQSVALEKVEGGYLLSASGKTWVEIKEFVEFEIGGVKRRLLSDSKVLTIELGPTPAPQPGPTPGPTPDPSPTPDKIADPSVLIIYESKDLPAYPANFRGVINSTDLQLWARNNKYGLAVLDKDTSFPATCDTVWCKWLAKPPPELPWVIIGNKSKIVHSGKLPASVDELKELAARYKQ